MLASLGVVLSFTVTSLQWIQASAQHAIDQSLIADMGGMAFALSTADPEAIDVLQSLPAATPIQDDSATLVADEAAVFVQLRVTTDPDATIGVLTAGHHPTQASEISLSATTADALGVAVGDEVTVTSTAGELSAEVVGLLIDPADPANSAAVLIPSVDQAFTPTRWLSNNDFYGVEELQPLLDRRTASYQSRDALLVAAAINRPGFLSSMQFLPVGVGLLVGVLFLSTLTLLLQRWTADVRSLGACGIPPVRSWRHVTFVALACVLAGEFVGLFLSFFILTTFKAPVSAWLGQGWTTITTPWSGILLILAITTVAVLLAVPVIRLVTNPPSVRVLSRWRFQLRPSRVRALAFSAVLFASWIGVVLVARQPGADFLSAVIPVLGVVWAATLPYLLSPLLAVGLPPGRRALQMQLLRGVRPMAAVVIALVVAVGTWSAQTTYSANSGEAQANPMVPSGSFVMSDVPDSAIPIITDIYQSYGGQEIIRYGRPDESQLNLRVTTRGLLECLAAPGASLANLPETCWPTDNGLMTPVNVVAIGEVGSEPRADPNLVSGGEVGLILLKSEDGSISRLAETTATLDPLLGGNMPGLVVPPDSNVLAELGVMAGGSSTVALLDFYSLSIADRVKVRGAVLRLAPGSELADGNDPTAFDRLRTVANTTGFVGAFVGAMFLLIGGMGLVVANSLTRRTLVDLGATAVARAVTTLRWIGIPAVSLMLSVPVIYTSASFGWADGDASYGWIWLVPPLVALLAVFAIGGLFTRVPDLQSD